MSAGDRRLPRFLPPWDGSAFSKELGRSPLLMNIRRRSAGARIDFCARFLSVLLVETPRAAALVNTFLARLLKNQERPMVVIRCNYVRMPADESETIPRRILLD